MGRMLDRTSVVTHTGLCNPSLASGDSPVGVATSHRVPYLASTKASLAASKTRFVHLCTHPRMTVTICTPWRLRLTMIPGS